MECSVHNLPPTRAAPLNLISCVAMSVTCGTKITVLGCMVLALPPRRFARRCPQVRVRWSWIAPSRGYTCSVTKPKRLVAWWILVTPTSSTMAPLALTAASLLFVAMKNSLPWKLK